MTLVWRQGPCARADALHILVRWMIGHHLHHNASKPDDQYLGITPRCVVYSIRTKSAALLESTSRSMCQKRGEEI